MPVCPSCGTANPDQAQFCMRCASPLPTGARPREVRKTVTVVFSDVTGSTALGERLDPESMREVINRYYDEMRSAIERHGGTVEKFIGDAVMAVFGIPAVHEDDALRAVRAASDMRDGLARLNVELEQNHGVTLAIRIGVNTGEVVAGDPGSGRQLVTGDAVNVAARLEQVAQPNEILVGEATNRLVRGVVEVEQVEALQLKGKSSPVRAFRLLHVSVEAGAPERRFDSPMVGRERQLAMLVQAFESAVADSACHLFTVLGTAGVGKSRLVREFLARLPEGNRVLRGRCLSYGEGITFWPVSEVLRDVAGIAEGDGPEERRAKIAAALRGADDAEVVADRLIGLLGVEASTDAPEETFWAVRRLLETAGRRHPLVVVIDDIHWAEPTLLDLIEYLADWTKGAPVLLLCPARPELLDRRSGWAGGKFNATSILLEPLPDEECERLIVNLLGSAQFPEDVRARILGAAEGTPLFVEEMVSMLIDDGLLEREDGHWLPTGDLSGVRVPPTIHALLAARLDQLPDEEREVAEWGSVEGKTFHRGAVTALAPETARPRLDSSLKALARRELIRPERADIAGQDAFRFRHQLIRDAAYQAVPKARRAELHERFAAWLEGVIGEPAADFTEIIGFHLEQAVRYRRDLGPEGDRERALAQRAGTLLADAGRRAVAIGDMPGAANLLERAVDLLPEADPQRIEAMLAAIEPLYTTSELNRAESLSAKAIEEARYIGDPVLEMRARIEHAMATIDPDEFVADADRVTPEAISLFEEMGDDQGLAAAWGLVAVRLNMKGHPPEMEEAFQRAIEHSRRAGDRKREVSAIVGLAGQLFWGETPVDEGLHRLEGLRHEIGDNRFAEARIGRNAAAFLAMQGRFDEARRMAEACLITFREIGASIFVNTMSFFTGLLELLAGDSVAAERALRSDCEWLREVGERTRYCSLVAFLGEALYRQGRYDEAYECTVASEKTAGAGDLEAQGDFRAVRAKVLARRGEFAEAERMAREAIEITKDSGEVDHDGDNWFDLAEVLRLAGRKDEAAEALRRAIGFWERKGNVVSVDKARALLEAKIDT